MRYKQTPGCLRVCDIARCKLFENLKKLKAILQESRAHIKRYTIHTLLEILKQIHKPCTFVRVCEETTIYELLICALKRNIQRRYLVFCNILFTYGFN